MGGEGGVKVIGIGSKVNYRYLRVAHLFNFFHISKVVPHDISCNTLQPLADIRLLVQLLEGRAYSTVVVGRRLWSVSVWWDSVSWGGNSNIEGRNLGQELVLVYTTRNALL